MTTYQSQTCYTVDRDENSLSFSTINEPGEEAVLKAVVQVELPDGQQVSVNVLYEGDDVRNLQAYLADNFSSRVRTAAVPLSDVRQAGSVIGVLPDGQLAVPGQVYLTDADGGIPASAFSVATPPTQNLDYYPENTSILMPPKPGDHVVVVGGNGHVMYEGKPNPQNDAGAVPPPADAQGAATALQSVGTDQSAAESATGAGAPEVPASQPAEQKTRKRRTKLEMAYDKAKEAYGTNPAAGAEARQTFQAARDALFAKEPGNSRFNQQAEQAQLSQDVPSGPAVGFAPEQPNGNPFNQPVPVSNYAQQMASPVNQEFANWVSNLPGEHHQDSVLMTPEQAATVPAFQPGQAQQLGQVQVSPEEGAAAQAFPCPVQSSDGRPCQRPYGHELMTDANPEPKPHVYATTDPQALGQPTTAQDYAAVAGVQPGYVGLTPAPAQPVQEYSPFSGPAPTGQLSFQVPPTPEHVQPHPETNLQPPAPAAPVWQQPQGGQ